MMPFSFLSDHYIFKMEKIKRFEAFLTERLKPDLENLLKTRDALYDEIAEYSKLKAQIELMESVADRDIKSLVRCWLKLFYAGQSV
ncbi:hypothetical protein BC829DRAFT_380215, partial [Chytridium lagenaria]